MLARLTTLGSLLGALAVPFAIGCGSSSSGSGPDGGTDKADAKPDAAPTTNTGTAITLTSLEALSYAAPLSFGSQKFAVIVDTGSSSTGVADHTCTTCSGVSNTYTAGSTATDEHVTTTSQYGDGSMWTGEVYSDSAKLGGGPATTIKFASITTDTGFFQRGGGYDGIMGFGPSSSLIPNTTSYLATAILNGLDGEIAFQLCPDTGTMWLGGYDSAAGKDTPVFVAQNAELPGYYAVAVADSSLDGTSLGTTSAEFGPTIIDTGTSLSYVPSAVLTKISNGISASSGYTTVFGTQQLDNQNGISTSMSSAQVDAMMPAFGVKFGSTTVSIPATKSYLAYEGSQGGQNYYFFAFQDSSTLFSGETASLFGDSMLNGLLAIFDVKDKKLGFAASVGCDEADVARRGTPYADLRQSPLFRAPPHITLPH